MSGAEVMHVVYLVSLYPGTSHTFIEREILGLRELGAEVDTVSVRRPSPDDLRSASMRSEAAQTTYLLGGSRGGLAVTVMRLALRHLLPVLRTAGVATHLGERRLRARVWQLFYLAEALLLVEHCRDRGARHIHVHFANNAADIARLAVELGVRIEGDGAGWRWSFTMHGPTEFEAVQAFDLAAKVRSASGVACISDFARSQLMRLVEHQHWRKLVKVHMSVETAFFVPPEDGRRGRGKPLRILMVGRLVQEKAPMVLLQTVDLLVQRGIPVDVRFVGSGTLGEELVTEAHRLRIDPYVTWLGPMGQHDILAWYHWADVFCLPSFQEGLPVVLMEAMATGLPVVTTRIAGITELVNSGVCGEVVAAGRPDLLADALARLSESPLRRWEQGRRGREAVLSSFTTQQSAADMQKFLNVVCAHSSPKAQSGDGSLSDPH